ncbi:MAG: DNA-binding protein [Clostridia bacterium]|nr:DNA-binding protein [Clostridia bacterium]
MEKDLTISYLNDIYGALLTKRQVEILDLYFTNDCSLGEIAEVLGISRQSVKDSLTASEKALRNFEKQLKLFEKKNSITKRVQNVKECIDKGNTKDAYILLDDVISILEE